MDHMLSQLLVERLLSELNRIRLIDPHSHINPHSAASKSLGDILGYHYFTELAHSAGLPRERIEEPGLSPKDLVARLVPKLCDIENTIQYSWLLHLCREFFDFEGESITLSNSEPLYDRAEARMARPDWEDEVLDRSGLDAVFLTNDFDDPLEGFDAGRYIPCLRTDDLVFKLTDPATRRRLAAATKIEVEDSAALQRALGQLFENF